jgi:hypothetical protein
MANKDLPITADEGTHFEVMNLSQRWHERRYASTDKQETEMSDVITCKLE